MFGIRPSVRPFVVVCCVLFCLVGQASAESTYGIRVAKTKTIRGVYSFVIHSPNLAAKEWILFAAQAPELPGQSHTSSRLLPDGQAFRDLSDRHRQLLRAQILVSDETQRHTLRGQIEWQATLYSRNLERREPNVSYSSPPVLSTSEHRAALAETTTLDYSQDVFQQWLRKHRLHKTANESDLDFGRHAFLAITHALRYDYAELMDRHASHICQTDRADCGGMCALFAATLRANGVPARMLMGRWARSADPHGTLDGAPYHQQHVKAEFYANGVGWIPVDLSSAVTHDKTPEGLRYFGHDHGDFLTVQLDPDVQVDSVHWGVKSLPLLQSFHYYVTGKGKLENVTFDRDWQVQTLP
jgi:hypothetical protein